MIIAVTGGRNFKDAELVDWMLSQYKITAIAHGGCRGLDAIVAKWASDKGIPTLEYKPDWDRHGAMAGPIRNRKMLLESKPKLLIRFTGGSGTANCAETAKMLGIPVINAKRERKVADGEASITAQP